MVCPNPHHPRSDFISIREAEFMLEDTSQHLCQAGHVHQPHQLTGFIEMCVHQVSKVFVINISTVRWKSNMKPIGCGRVHNSSHKSISMFGKK